MLAKLYKRKDQKLRKIIDRQEIFKCINNFLLKQKKTKQKNRALINYKFYKLYKGNKMSFTRVRNRCLITSRARSVYRRFRLNRLAFKYLVALGYLPGFGRST